MSDMLNGFFPKVISVHKRYPDYWVEKNNAVRIGSANIRNVLFVYSGSGQLVKEEGQFDLTAGHIFHVTIGERFELYNSRKDPLLFYSVHYDFRQVEWEGDQVRCQEPGSFTFPFPNVMRLEQVSAFTEQMEQLYRLWNEKDRGYEWRARLAFLQMVEELYAHAWQTRDAHANDETIVRSMDHIRQHYDEPITREGLAEMAALSTNHFAMLFKQYSCFTPMQYLTRVRLDQAKHMLRTTNLPVADIARKTGYHDPLYFTKVFVKETGFSPRAYRKA